MRTTEEFVKERILADTGAMARFLGFDYDKDEQTGKVTRPGGVRPDGPYQDMVAFVDGPERQKLLMAPRGSYKSTILIAYVIRKILGDPHRRFVWGMATSDVAKNVVETIRDLLESERVITMFGDVTTKDWKGNSFTIAGRQRYVKEPSLTVFAIEKNVTGNHCDELILDDLVIEQNSRTEGGLARAIKAFKGVQPLLDPGGILTVSNTEYHDADLTNLIRNEMRDPGDGTGFKILVIDSGVDIEREEATGKFKLTGTPRFPHQPMSFLEAKLRITDPYEFSHQYLNRAMPGGLAEFDRRMFRPVLWRDEMRNLNFYMCTDTAASSAERACMSVVGMVGLDANADSYLVDLVCGHLTTDAYVQALCDMFERWNNKSTVRGCVFERGPLSSVFRNAIEQETRKRGYRIRIIEASRGSSAPSKVQRIRSLHPRFQQGRFFVASTVPRVYHDHGQAKLLWDAEGYYDAKSKLHLPAGELVTQFINFPMNIESNRCDIADALADMDAIDHMGNRLMQGSRYSMAQIAAQKKQERGRPLNVAALMAGRVEYVDHSPMAKLKENNVFTHYRL